VTETISSMPEQIDAQQLAQQLVEKARVEGIDLVGPGGLLTGLTKTVLETALDAELSEHLGYDKHDPAGRNGGNSRNGTRSKTVLTEVGPVEIEVPRDRDGSFDPVIVRKRQRRLDGIDQIVPTSRVTAGPTTSTGLAASPTSTRLQRPRRRPAEPALLGDHPAVELGLLAWALLQDAPQPGLGRGDMHRGGRLGEGWVTVPERPQDVGVLGDRARLGVLLDDAPPHPRPAGPVGDAGQHGRQRLVARGGGHRGVELFVVLDQLLVRPGVPHLLQREVQ
jgi:hypothetical protein